MYNILRFSSKDTKLFWWDLAFINPYWLAWIMSLSLHNVAIPIPLLFACNFYMKSSTWSSKLQQNIFLKDI